MALDRIVALVDMDCFYVQVEQRRNPQLKGKPCAVVQYKKWKGGAIIAVGYEARKFGVTRNMRGDEAKEKCPEITLVKVPEARGKANLIHYREAGAEIIEVLSRFCENCERASVDEAYLDLTENVEMRTAKLSVEEIAQQTAESTFIEGFMVDDGDSKRVDGEAWLEALKKDGNIKRLAVGAIIVSEMRAAVLKETQFTCSAGVAHNKMLSKLCGGLHKPNKQTLLPQSSVPKVFETVPIQKVRNMGGKLGHEVCSLLKVDKMSDIARYSLGELQGHLGDKTGEWLYYLSHGIDHEPVRRRQLPKSTGCSKNFPGKTKLATTEQVKHWLGQLASELHERLTREAELNKREARLVTVGVRTESDSSFSRSCHLKDPSATQIAEDLFNLLLPFNMNKDSTGKNDTWHPAIITLNMSASRFEDIPLQSNTPSISSFFNKKSKIQTSLSLDEPGYCSIANLPEHEIGKKESKEQLSEGNSSAVAINVAAEESTKEFKKVGGTFGMKSRGKMSNNVLQHKKGIEFFFSGGNLRKGKDCGGINDTNKKTVTRITAGAYQECEIDISVLESLPEDIRQEIQQSLQKNARETQRTEQHKDTLTNRIPDGRSVLPRGEFSSNNSLTSSSGEIAKDFNLVQCERCKRELPKWEMQEHLDYHFALDLEEREKTELDGAANGEESGEPPKKKPRTTIRSFFTPNKAT